MKFMVKMRKKCKKLNNKGFTLVELICTFAIIGLFMVAATNVILSAMNIHYEVKGTTNGMMVSSIITKKLSDTIEGALTGNNISTNEGENSYIIVRKNELDGEIKADSVELTDNSGSHVKVSVNDEGYLDIYYYEVAYIDETVQNEAPDVLYKAVHWTFDDAVYMGYKIKSFRILKSDSNLKDNVFEIRFTLDHEKYGDYETTKYIECYNFSKPEDVEKIQILEP